MLNGLSDGCCCTDCWHFLRLSKQQNVSNLQHLNFSKFSTQEVYSRSDTLKPPYTPEKLIRFAICFWHKNSVHTFNSDYSIALLYNCIQGITKNVNAEFVLHQAWWGWELFKHARHVAWSSNVHIPLMENIDVEVSCIPDGALGQIRLKPTVKKAIIHGHQWITQKQCDIVVTLLKMEICTIKRDWLVTLLGFTIQKNECFITEKKWTHYSYCDAYMQEVKLRFLQIKK